jgi:UDP-N-acetylglucosamine diphosphorylase/glucosamine-1-phosphate N-acetyltransferase
MGNIERQLSAVVLAAGKGKRMRSQLPKVLHKIAGKALVAHVLDTLNELGVRNIVVVTGYGADLVKSALRDYQVQYVLQAEQLGTGHATQVTEAEFSDFEGDVLVLAGDVPLLRADTLRDLIDVHRDRGAVATVLTARLPDPSGYGRIVRDRNSKVLKIVEHKDATESEKEIDEINTGTFVFEVGPLFDALHWITNDNNQGEYYLTDVMKIFLDRGQVTAAHCVSDYRETLGVNSPEELAEAESLLR